MLCVQKPESATIFPVLSRANMISCDPSAVKKTPEAGTCIVEQASRKSWFCVELKAPYPDR